MTITSKLVVRTLVVLIGLGIFVRGIWISQHLPSKNWLDFLNWAIVIVFSFFLLIYYIFKIVIFLDQPVRDIWTGEKQLFKPFKINFKFKK